MPQTTRALPLALALLLLLTSCSRAPGNSSGSSGVSSGSDGSGASSGAAPSLTPEEGQALLEARLGKRDAVSDSMCYYTYRDTLSLDGADYYNYDYGWLPDGSHAAYITNYLVSVDGQTIREYIPKEVASARAELEGASAALLESMQAGDFAAIAEWADEDGVTFTPYSTVNFTVDRTVTPAELAAFATDSAVYTWGIYDGSGESIEMTSADYWARFVWNTDYTAAPDVSVNRYVQQGNSWENAGNAYPCSPLIVAEGQHSYVEYHFSGLDPDYGGVDWCALKLAFVRRGDAWKLAGIVHSEMTL